MASTQAVSGRAGRLRGLFRDVLSGNRQVRDSRNAQLSLEAIRDQEPASGCIEKIMSSKFGLDGIKDAIRVDLSTSFILAHTLAFLRYLSDPGIKALVDGQLLRQVILVVAHPPTLWNSLLRLFHDHQIPEGSLYPFAWLVLELVSLPSNTEVDVLQDVQEIVEEERLLKAQSHETRELGYKIKKVLQIRCSPQQSDQAAGPGGRHDNDFADFRAIRIYPTTDEFLSTQQPFYRTAKEVFETQLADRARVYLDNQSRLLREDMLAELREDLQVATGQRKGKQSTSALGRLVPVDLDVGPVVFVSHSFQPYAHHH